MANARPFYIISHRCNDKNCIKDSLKEGANAFECDLHYGKRKNKWVVNHDGYFPNLSITLEDWINEAYDNQNDNLCFLYLDIKSYTHLDSLIEHVHDCANKHIQSGKKPIKIIYSIASLDDAMEQFKENISKFDEWEGITVDYNNNPTDVNTFYKALRNSEKEQGRNFERFFYGNGITAACPDTEKMRKNLRSACELRDKDKVIKKTFIWTIEKKDTAKTYLDIGVDAIMTNVVSRNHIDNIYKAIEEHNNSSENQVRLATTADDLFTVFTP